jgi:hypothetical protein
MLVNPKVAINVNPAVFCRLPKKADLSTQNQKALTVVLLRKVTPVRRSFLAAKAPLTGAKEP